ncbi:hypothetical protein SRABI128_05730 [Microbacterium sp. Bi128]|nr:hypothetical protein SRABI128_05730 [Microbacterium sp. Bi128]
MQYRGNPARVVFGDALLCQAFSRAEAQNILDPGEALEEHVVAVGLQHIAEK